MILNELSKRNKEWHRIALSICKDEHLANDLVQKMYLRMRRYITDPEKIKVDGKINSLYIYVTIKNLFYQHKNKKKKNIFLEYKDYDAFDENNTYEYNTDMTSSYEEEIDVVNMEKANEIIMNNIENEIKTWHWYDEKLFRLYYFTNKSLRQIASETKISLTSIYNSCKNYKNIIEEKFGEDIADFFNKDYDKIK
jgi:RNA polymerase sigma factor (sigma-70 family)|tara:strand:+ start:442 stop:1026 length:585 start_codon:yes stop_codon:yes gene_type:complete